MKDDSTKEVKGEKGAKLTLIFLVAVIGIAMLILIAQGTGLL